jgi:hypothetical protein
MAAKTPLVVGSDGLLQQLQSGDTLSVAVTTTQIRAVTNGEASLAMVIGAPVYASAADTVKLAKANAASTSMLQGLGYDTTVAAAGVGNIIEAGVLVATTAQWDAVVTSGSGGLVFNTKYFLDPANFGKLTTTVPTTVGQTVTLVGVALSTTEMRLILNPYILL